MSAAVRLSPVPPAFRLIRKTGTSPAWKRSTGVARSRTSPVILTKAMSAAASRSSINASMLVNWENKSTRRPSSTSSLQHLHETNQLGGAGAALLDRRQLDQAGIAAHLPQLQERIEDDDAAAVEALGGDRLANLPVHGEPHRLVDRALSGLHLDVLDDLGLRRQLGRDLRLGAP